MSRGFASNSRIFVLAGGMLLAFGGLGARLVWLHVLDRKELLSHIEQVRHEVIDEPAIRGNIFDRKGSILATSRSMIVLQADPSALRPADAPKWPRLAELAGMPLAELTRLLTTKTRPAGGAAGARPGAAAAESRPVEWVKLCDEISESDYAEVTRLGIEGVYGTRVYRRAYPHHELAAHLVGYVDGSKIPSAASSPT